MTEAARSLHTGLGGCWVPPEGLPGPCPASCCPSSLGSLACTYNPEETKQDTGPMGMLQKWLWLRGTVNWESQDTRWSGPGACPAWGWCDLAQPGLGLPFLGKRSPGTPSQHLQGPLFLSYWPPHHPAALLPHQGPSIIPTLGSVSRPYSEALSPQLSSFLIVPTAGIKGHHCQHNRLSAY